MNNKLIYHLIGLRFMENAFISNKERRRYELISDHFESSWSMSYHANFRSSGVVISSFRSGDEYYCNEFTVDELMQMILYLFGREAGFVISAVQGLCKTPEKFLYKNQSVDDL